MDKSLATDLAVKASVDSASTASHSGTGPYQVIEDSISSPVFNEIDDSYASPDTPGRLHRL